MSRDLGYAQAVRSAIVPPADPGRRTASSGASDAARLKAAGRAEYKREDVPGSQPHHWSSSSKKRSRDIPAVRRLFLMMNTGTDAYLGITTGRRHAGLGEQHVVALDADAGKTVSLKHFHQPL